MTALLQPLREAATYRSLLFLATAVPSAAIGGALLVAGWSLTLALAITPAVVAVLIGFRAAVGAIAAWEAFLARELLAAHTGAQQLSAGGRGFWRRGTAVLGDRAFWRQQSYLVLRLLVGGPLGIAVFSVLGSALYVIGLPIYYRWTQANADFPRIDTLQKAVLVVPLGVVGLVLALHVVRPLASVWRRAAESLLAARRQRPDRDRRAESAHAAAPRPGDGRGRRCARRRLAAAGRDVLARLAHHRVGAAARAACLGRICERNDASWCTRGVTASFAVFFVLIWAAAGGGYFWPIWPSVALGGLLALHVGLVRARRSELEERIETLETSRAGAVDVQESELRRIERDLHDGAQARLVALGMNLGMAEQKLAADPVGARELVSEARAGIEEALRELRDLARGIHPPVLTDRGLEAAISALADRSAIPVIVTADVPDRPAAAVESAAYFVAAEALTNAAKHADASRVEVRIVRRPKSLVVEVTDDGRGGADPLGSGLVGLRRRVEALDGTLLVVSPSDGGTTLRAELPCAS